MSEPKFKDTIVVKYRAYDTDLHRYLTDDEVRIAPSGQVYYEDGGGVWLPLPPTAEWLVVEAV